VTSGIKRFEVFHGTKAAQRAPRFIESIQLLSILAEAHNLKVIGSNPIPATKLSS
jgi:hypothetical protein